jgi:hypothetical protein
MIKYTEVLNKGFAMSKIDILPISEKLDGLSFILNEDRKKGVEVSWSTFGLDKELNDYLKKELSKICDDYLKKLIEDIVTFEAYKTDIGEYTDLHSDSAFGGLIQVMIYYIKEDLEGRDFLYGDKSSINSIKPFSGLVVVCDQLNKEWLHGTTPLENNCYNLCITAIR